MHRIPSEPPLRFRWLWITGVAAVYYGAARLGLLLAFEHTNASPVWPPSGFALAAVLLLGYRIWPGIFIGAFLANFATLFDPAFIGLFRALPASLLIGAGNTLEAVIGVVLLDFFIESRNPMNRTQDVFKFVAVAPLMCLVAATIGPTVLYLAGILPGYFYKTAWATWWLGDLTGVFVLTPVFLAWRFQTWHFPEFRWWLETGLLVLTLLFISRGILGSRPDSVTYSRAYFLFPFLLWAVFRLGEPIALTMVVMVSIMAVLNTLHGLGPFVGNSLNESLLSIQTFVGVISVTMMVLAATLRMKKRADSDLLESNVLLEKKVDERTLSLKQKTRELIATNADLERFNKVTLDREERILELKTQVNEFALLRGDDPPYDFTSSVAPFGPVTETKERGAEKGQNKPDRQTRVMQSLLEDLHETGKKTLSNLAAIVESSDDAIMGKTLDGIITSWNHGAEVIYGYTAEEIIGKPFFILMPSEKREELQKLLNRIKQGKSVHHYETARTRKDGSSIHVSLTLSPIKDGKGKIVGVSTVSRDITDRKLAEERLRHIVESVPSGIVIANKEGKIVLVNRQTERLFGYSRQELMGKAVEILVPERFRKNHPGDRAGFTAHPTSRPMGAGRDLFALHKDGHEIPVEIGLNPIETDEGLLILSSIIDITERKKVDELKDNFLSMVSHELRTPLAILKMGVENLEANRVWKLETEEKETVETLKRSTDRLEKLINDLLNLSRLESGKIKIARQNLSIDSLIADVLANFKLLAKEENIRLKTDLEAGLPPVSADPELLLRVITNLLNNALRFAESEIILATRRNNSLLEVSVIDDGPGIKPEHIPSLFNKFVQVNRPQGGGGYKGTGLGLAICREIVQLHNGKIWAESTVGAGARFCFTIPFGQVFKKETLFHQGAGT